MPSPLEHSISYRKWIHQSPGSDKILVEFAVNIVQVTSFKHNAHHPTPNPELTWAV